MSYLFKKFVFWCLVRFHVRLVGRLFTVGLMNMLRGCLCGVCVLVGGGFIDIIVGGGVIFRLVW